MMTNPILPQLVFAVTFIAEYSVASIILYALVRWVEKRYLEYPLSEAAQIVVFSVLFFTLLTGSVAAFLSFPPLLILALLGGFFHRKAGGESVHIVLAVLTFTVILSVCFVVGFYLKNDVHRASPVAHYAGMDGFMLLVVYLYPPLMPLGWWFWNSLRARPGLEVHQEEVEFHH